MVTGYTGSNNQFNTRSYAKRTVNCLIYLVILGTVWFASKMQLQQSGLSCKINARRIPKGKNTLHD